jgi:hypothetical protein
MEFGQLHHVEYFVNDLSRSNESWSWFLPMGYSKYQEFAEGISWSHKNETYLVFCQVEKQHLNAQNTRQGNGLNHIAFMGGSLTDLDRLQHELEGRKVKILKRSGAYLCFEDPNEFAVEVYAKEDA